MSSKSKKILGLITIVVLLLICIGGSEVSATNIVAMNISNTAGNKANTSVNASAINITTGGESSTKNNVVNNATNNTANTNKNTNANINVNNKSLYNNANKNSSSLPYTGTSDSVLFIVGALLVSAIYAYKKIRDYNV